MKKIFAGLLFLFLLNGSFAGEVKNAVLGKMKLKPFENLVQKNVENKDELGLALRNASNNNMVSHAEILIHHGADVNSTGASKKPAFWHAVKNGHYEMADLLAKQPNFLSSIPDERSVIQLLESQKGGISNENVILENLIKLKKLTKWQLEYVDQKRLSKLADLLALLKQNLQQIGNSNLHQAVAKGVLDDNFMNVMSSQDHTEEEKTNYLRGCANDAAGFQRSAQKMDSLTASFKTDLEDLTQNLDKFFKGSQ